MKAKKLFYLTLSLILLFTFTACNAPDESSDPASGSITVSGPEVSTPAEESYYDAELKYAIDRTLTKTLISANAEVSVTVDGTAGDTTSLAAAEYDICVSLDSTASGIADVSFVLEGANVPATVKLVISTDELDWYLVADIPATATETGAEYKLELEKGFRARYLRFIFNSEQAPTLTAVNLFIYDDTRKMYVNAIDNKMICSVVRDGDIPVMFGEGQGAIVSFGFQGNFPGPLVWNKIVACAPTETEGKYVITALYKNVGGDETKYDAAIPENGFCYVVNLGNDYPAILQSNPSRTDLVGFPNYTTEEINSSFLVVDTLEIGDFIYLNNIDLKNGIIDEGFGSYLSVGK